MNFGRILIKLGPNVDSLSIDPDSVSGKTPTEMMSVTESVTESVFATVLRLFKSMKQMVFSY